MKTLMLWPCCSAKDGVRATGEDGASIETFLSPQDGMMLAEGRNEELNPFGATTLRALDFYSGYLYQINGFRAAVNGVLAQDFHPVILSAAYGLIRANEPIQAYDREMKDAIATWQPIVPTVLANYLQRNSIQRAFFTFGRTTPYRRLLFGRRRGAWAPRFVHPGCQIFACFPFYEGGGVPLREVPKMQGEAVRDLIQNNFEPDDRWVDCGIG